MADQEFFVVRPGDLMAVGVELFNVRLSDDGARLVRLDASAPASVVLRLPPQHFREPVSFVEVLEVPTTAQRTPLTQVPIVAGRRSRFEFVLPADAQQVPIGWDGLIGLLEHLGLDPAGTYVDFPAGLSTRPAAPGWDFGPPPAPVGRTPLWTLRPRVPRGTVLHLSWSAQYPIRDDLGGIIRPVDLPFRRDYRAERMVLTSLGGTVQMSGPADAAPMADTYQHLAVLGRDVYVRTITGGCLSSGHRASLVTVVERSLRRARVIRGATLDVVDEQVIGSLVGTTTLAVTEPFLDLTGMGGGYPFGGREMPFTALRITTQSAVVNPPPGGGPFWVRSDEHDVMFDIVATDRAGRAVTMQTPLVFVPDGSFDAVGVNRLLEAERATVHPGPVALADPAGRPNGSTDVVLSGLSFRVAGTAMILPTVADLDIVLDAVAGFSGPAPTVRARLADGYLRAGMAGPGNPLGAFVELERPYELNLGIAASGGLAKPGGKLGVITAERGAIPAEFAAGGRLTKELLRQALGSPKLFGGVDLLDLIDESALERGPELTRRSLPEGDEFRYVFSAPLRGVSALGAVQAVEGAFLSLDSRVLRAADGRSVGATSSGTVTGMRFVIAGVVELAFDRIAFRSDGGGKTAIEVGRPNLRFFGALSFLQEIAATLARAGLGAGARVEQDAGGVTAGFGIEIPTIALGVVQLSNLSVESWVRLPFGDEPMSFSLAIANKHRPFIATVSMFGGGGYLALELSTHGLRSLDIAIEFGGSMCLDIVVASGGVTVMAGIYFFLRQIDGRSELGFRGYVRCAGYLSVLGIITVSVEFYLELNYTRKVDAAGRTHHVLGGRASLSVSIEVLFFSKSVTLTVEREFIGSAADPPFAECVSEADWDVYCDAFAVEPGTGGPA